MSRHFYNQLLSSPEEEVQGQIHVPIVSLEGLLALGIREAHVRQLFDLIVRCLFLGKLQDPLPASCQLDKENSPRCGFVCFLVSFVLLGYFCILRVVGFGGTEQSLERNERSSDGKRRGPLVPQNVEADGAGLAANVGMPYFSIEFHLSSWLR